MRSINFDNHYFEKNVDKLRLLRDYLRRNVNFNPQDIDQCRYLRIYGLSLMDSDSQYMDRSLGSYIIRQGGVQKFLETPIYRLSYSVAAVTFVHVYAAKENWNLPISNLSTSQYHKILQEIFGDEIEPSDSRVYIVSNLCKHSTLKVEDVVMLIEEELGEITDDMLDNLVFELKSVMDHVCHNGH